MRSCLRHVPSCFAWLGGELLGLLLVRDRAPALGREQEVVDVAGRDRARRERLVLRRGVQPLPLGQRVRRVQAAARADEGVAADQVQAEPGGLQAAVHDVEPDRDLGQLDGGLVEVDAVAVVQGDVGLDLLQVEGALVRFEAVAGLFLAQPQVLGGELVDGLVEERAGARARARRPASGAPRPAVTVAALLLDPLLQGELDGDRGQRLRGVVGGAGLPVPAGQPVDERPGPVADPLAGREAVLVLRP